ncbi:hypothetical protein [Streptomyces sp. NPDC020607]|uniref:hypothetical protein n=1 Tax=Streptomyces sp. NPDC020607 TaxID=3365082 RepID=UPI0037BDE3BC
MTANARDKTESVPYITMRAGEAEESFWELRASFTAAGSSRLKYRDETRRDRDVQGVLWARMSQKLDPKRQWPTGLPLHRLINPNRQHETMLGLLCQWCKKPARTRTTPKGLLVFLESARRGVPTSSAAVRTAQPPVCLRCAVKAVERWSGLVKHGVVVLLAQSAPLYGVMGTRYEYVNRSIRALDPVDEPIPYGHSALDWVLASQLIRTPRAFTVISVADLYDLAAPATAAQDNYL